MFDTMNQALEMRKGYENSYILGKVTINIDPSNKGLIKAEAAGLYDPSMGDVPWVGLLKKSPFGQSKDWGVYGSPWPGSDVALELQQGNPNYGLYHDIQRFAAPKEFEKSGKVWGFKDPIGNWFRVDLETKEVDFVTSTGVKFHVSAEGELTVTTGAKAELNMPELVINANVKHYGSITSNDVNIGSDHVHSGVEIGGSDTQGPH
jgi:hypothetical protein